MLLPLIILSRFLLVTCDDDRNSDTNAFIVLPHECDTGSYVNDAVMPRFDAAVVTSLSNVHSDDDDDNDDDDDDSDGFVKR